MWKLTEILTELEKAGLPEPYKINLDKYGIELVFPKNNIELRAISENRGFMVDDDFFFNTLPEAIEKLKELLK